MASLKEFFEIGNAATTKGVAYKTGQTKRGIVARLATGDATLAELASQLNISIPTTTKLVAELIADGLVADLGKVETAGGRRPNSFGLAAASVYFAGVGIGRDRIDFVVTDLSNGVAARGTVSDFTLEDSAACLEKIISKTDKFLNGSGIARDKVIAAGVSLPGRVNRDSGRSNNWFDDPDAPLRDVLRRGLGLEIMIENDTRAQCYAELQARAGEGVSDMIYMNIGLGFAIGIVVDGKVYRGKSGYAGEFGHVQGTGPNYAPCPCGKAGCIETEMSGLAAERWMAGTIKENNPRYSKTMLRDKWEATGHVGVDDIVEAAVRHGDPLSMDVIAEVSEKAGCHAATLLNIFNPELLVVGGRFVAAGDNVMLPLKTHANRNSTGAVYNDTRFEFARTDRGAGALGAAMMIRNTILGTL